MPRSIRLAAIGIVLCVQVAGLKLQAQVPSTFGYVGHLVDDDGPVDYPVDIDVAIFASATTGPDEVAIWTENHDDVPVDDGRFVISMGSQSQLDPAWFETDALFLSLEVDGIEMTPRIPMSSVPFSFRSALADDALALDGNAASNFARSGHGHDDLASVDDALTAVDAAGYVDGPACVEAVDESGRFLRVDGTAALGGDWNVAGYQLLNIVVENAAAGSAPDSPVAGQLWWDTDADRLNVYDGASWVSLGAGPTRETIEALGFVTGGHTGAPTQGDIEALGFVAGAHTDPAGLVRADGTTPLAGDWDVAGNQLLNLVVQNAAADSAPAEPSAGQLWWDTDNDSLQVYDGEAWASVGNGASADDIEALGFVPGGHTPAPTTGSIEALGFVTGSHTSAPSREDIEALGFVPGTPDVSGLEDINLGLLTSVITREYAAGDVPLLDPQNGSPVVSTLEAMAPGTIRAVTVAVEVTHADPNEYSLILTSPGGTPITLHDGGVTGLDPAVVFPTDRAAVDGDFADLVGESAAGTWTLALTDAVVGSTGTLVQWSVSVTLFSAERIEIDGTVSLGGHRLEGVADPSADDDGASKAYVDNQVEERRFPGTYLSTSDMAADLNCTSSGATVRQFTRDLVPPEGANLGLVYAQGNRGDSEVNCLLNGIIVPGLPSSQSEIRCEFAESTRWEVSWSRCHALSSPIERELSFSGHIHWFE